MYFLKFLRFLKQLFSVTCTHLVIIQLNEFSEFLYYIRVEINRHKQYYDYSYCYRNINSLRTYSNAYGHRLYSTYLFYYTGVTRVYPNFFIRNKNPYNNISLPYAHVRVRVYTVRRSTEKKKFGFVTLCAQCGNWPKISSCEERASNLFVFFFVFI